MNHLSLTVHVASTSDFECLINENSNPQNHAYSWFLVPEKCSVRRVIYNNDDDNDIDADAASENSESLSVHDDY